MLQIAATRCRPLSSECMCTKTGLTRATSSLAYSSSPPKAATIAVDGPARAVGAEGSHAADVRVFREQAEELAGLRAMDLTDDQPPGVHAPGLGEQRVHVGAGVHAESHAERALLQGGQVQAALDGDEAVVHGYELKEGVEQAWTCRWPRSPTITSVRRSLMSCASLAP